MAASKTKGKKSTSKATTGKSTSQVVPKPRNQEKPPSIPVTRRSSRNKPTEVAQEDDHESNPIASSINTSPPASKGDMTPKAQSPHNQPGLRPASTASRSEAVLQPDVAAALTNDSAAVDSPRPRPVVAGSNSTPHNSGEYEPVSESRQQEVFKASLITQKAVQAISPVNEERGVLDVNTASATAETVVHESQKSPVDLIPSATVVSTPSGSPPIRSQESTPPTSTEPTGVPSTPIAVPPPCADDVPTIAQEPQLAVASKGDVPAVGPSRVAKGKARARDDDTQSEVEPTGSHGEDDSSSSDDDDDNEEGFNDAERGADNDDEHEEGRSDSEVQEEEPARVRRGKRTACSSSKKPMKTGPLSADALKEVHAFSDECRARSEALGVKFGKSPGYILQAAGLGFRPSRATNPSNEYSRWWASTNAERMAGVGLQERNKIMRKEYSELMEGVGDDDAEERNRRMQPIYDEIDGWGEQELTPESASRRMDKAMSQFTNLERSYSTVGDMEIAGFVIYMGTDNCSKAKSAFWGGSGLIEHAIKKYNPDLEELMEMVVTVLKSMKYSQRGYQIDCPEIIEKVPSPKDDKKRDGLRGKMSRRMRRKYVAHSATWARYRRHSPGRPGAMWHTSTASASQIMRAADIQIVAWDDDELELLEQNFGNVPVVLGVNDAALKCVRDSEQWNKAMNQYKRGDFMPSSVTNVDTSAAQVQPSKTGGRKRKAQQHEVITLPDDSDSSDSSKVIAKRPRLRSSSPHNRVTQSDSSDESSSSDSDVSPAPPVKKTKVPKSKVPSQDHSAATTLAQILSALPAEFLQSVLPQHHTTGPIAGPSRLPHGSGGSGSGSKGKKSGRKRSH
ncbi:hypothetical protein NLI96_g12550 [Meripilus lineatus]|uniref:Uncharacterized protein n=1 Tax=Meripilus lineatus TaxID=2056292 RepID=A0AAD5UUD9_9APHY|nr:hypothetical protein NLI96_g12550 [Physisporinus lineatus]